MLAAYIMAAIAGLTVYHCRLPFIFKPVLQYPAVIIFCLLSFLGFLYETIGRFLLSHYLKYTKTNSHENIYFIANSIAVNPCAACTKQAR